MGADKATLLVDGRAMAARVADSLAAAGCGPVLLVGRATASLDALGLPVVADRWPGEGPLGAIATAVDAAPGRDLMVVACDLPLLSASAVAAVAGAAVDGVALAHGQRREPLCSRWSAAAAELAAAAFVEGARAVHEALAVVERAGLTVVDVAVDPRELRNVNTPDDVPGSVARMSVPEISVEELAALVDRGARLIDVREPAEFAEAHVPGAVLVPLGTVPDQVDAFRGDGTTYVICRSGARSARAVEFVAQHGIDAVNVAGGTLAWIESGRPVDTGAQPS